MPVTKEDCIKAGKDSGTIFHYGKCVEKIGPYGGVTRKIQRFRVNGKCKIFKTMPLRFRLPVKYGMYQYGYISESNCEWFHLEKDCPILKSVQTEIPFRQLL